MYNAKGPMGIWQDTYIYSDGRVVVSDWKKNQIQDTQSTLAAMLMKSTRAGSNATYSGIEYFAVGEGQSSWDLSAPTKAYTQTTLETELWRNTIDSTTQVFFVNPTTFVVSGSPTRALQFNLVIPSEVVGDLREFGLFGGTATLAADSGYMVNWITHDVITKDTTMQINRTLRIVWQNHEEVCP